VRVDTRRWGVIVDVVSEFLKLKNE
jgi:hypothetical protein